MTPGKPVPRERREIGVGKRAEREIARHLMGERHDSRVGFDDQHRRNVNETLYRARGDDMIAVPEELFDGERVDVDNHTQLTTQPLRLEQRRT